MAIRDVLQMEPGERKIMGIKGRDAVLKGFSYDELAAHFERVFN